MKISYCKFCKQPFECKNIRSKVCNSKECFLAQGRETTRNYRERHRNNPNWKARLNRRIYLNQQKYNFGTTREEILKRFNNLCTVCKGTLRLQIHHINGIGSNTNKPDNKPENLIVLCQKCHRKVDIYRRTRKRYLKMFPKQLLEPN